MLGENIKEIKVEGDSFVIKYKIDEDIVNEIYNDLQYDTEHLKKFDKEAIIKILTLAEIDDADFLLEVYNNFEDEDIRKIVKEKLKEMNLKDADDETLLIIYKKDIIDKSLIKQAINYNISTYGSLNAIEIGLKILKEKLEKDFKEEINKIVKKAIEEELRYNFFSIMRTRYTQHTEDLERVFEFLSSAHKLNLINQANLELLKEVLNENEVKKIVKRKIHKKEFHNLLMYILEFFPNLSNYKNMIIALEV